jgi:chromosome segregation ATPase
MPYLYGQPFKHELRAEIRQLRSDLWKAQKERRDTNIKLKWARFRIEELEALNLSHPLIF